MLDTQKMIKDILDKLHPNAVAHLASGGFLGGNALGQAGAWAVNPLAGQVATGVNASGLGNGFLGSLLTNPAQALTPQNNYYATTNPGAQTDFSGAIGQGQGTVGQGVGNAEDSIGFTRQSATNLNNTAGQQAATAGKFDSVLGQQQTLANALAQQAAGGGPNPAQDQFRQNADAAAQQAASTIESTKGINPGLAAQLAMRMQSGAGQAAAGQAATLQAQQQLAAQQALAGQQQAMGNTIASKGNALAGAGSTQAAAGNLQATAGNLGLGQASAGNSLYGTSVQGQEGQNSNDINAQLGTSGLNQKTSAQNTQDTAGTQGGLLNALGSAVGLGGSKGLFAEGGVVGHMAFGGGLSPMVQQILGAPMPGAPKPIWTPPQTPGAAPAAATGTNVTPGGYAGADVGPAAAGSDAVTGAGAGDAAAATSATAGGGAEALVPLVALAAKGGYGEPAKDQVPGKYDQKAMGLAEALMARGGQVPGKPQYPGNDYRNDVVPTVLSKGEVVLPNEVTESEHPAEMAKKFVEALAAKSHPSFGRVLKARQSLAAAEEAHRRCMGGAA